MAYDELYTRVLNELGPMVVTSCSESDQRRYLNSLDMLGQAYKENGADQSVSIFVQVLSRYSDGSGTPTLVTITADEAGTPSQLAELLSKLLDELNPMNGNIFDVFVNGVLARTVSM